MDLKHFLTEGPKEKFLIQDPFGLREAVQPVVSISQATGSIRGLGTCFQVSPWLWLTAHHVVRHSKSEAFPKGEVGAVGFSPGLVYGTCGFTSTDIFGEVVQCLSYSVSDDGSSSFIPCPKAPDIVLDVASLRVNVESLKRPPLRSPLPISKLGPQIGEEVLAIGYPILGSKLDPNKATEIFEERMFGASGVVKSVHPTGTSTSKPWPAFEIEGDWEAGLSGGPVINTKGHVIGLVSSSFAPTDDAPGTGFAVDLSKVPLHPIAPEIDFNRPGYAIGFGVFDAGVLRGFFPTLEMATKFATGSQGMDVKKITFDSKTDEWIEITSDR